LSVIYFGGVGVKNNKYRLLYKSAMAMAFWKYEWCHDFHAALIATEVFWVVFFQDSQSTRVEGTFVPCLSQVSRNSRLEASAG
jgi:hypothetical protein